MKISTTLLILVACLILNISATTFEIKEGYSILNQRYKAVNQIFSVGDMNGDGYSDFAYVYEDNLEQKSIFIIYGNSTQSLNDFHISNMTEEKGIIIAVHKCSRIDSFGSGDFNKDGYSDMIFVVDWRQSYLKKLYVIYGGPKLKNLHTINMTETQGILISQIFKDLYILSVASVGDVNGDGIDDIVVSFTVDYNYLVPRQAIAYIIYGGFPWKDLNDIISLTRDQGYKIESNDMQKIIKYSIESAGDINNDGYADFKIHADYFDESHREGITVILGGKSLDNLNIGNMTKDRGFNITHKQTAKFQRLYSSYAGDFNNDGFSDLISFDYSADEAFVLFGEKLLENYEVHDALKQKKAIKINTKGNNINWIIHTAGDFNNDGYSDVIFYSQAIYGVIRNTTFYVVYGNSSPDTIYIKNLTPKQAFIKTNIYGLYPIIVPAGDVNKDGFSDIVYLHPQNKTVSVLFGRSSAEIGKQSLDFLK